MVKVYRPDGTEEEKAAVDARECVKHCGYSYEPVVSEAESADDIKATEAESADDTKATKAKTKAAASVDQNPSAVG